MFINRRTVLKKNLPLNCLRLYTARARVENANANDFKILPGEEVRAVAQGSYVGTLNTARRVLKETRLSQELLLKVGMPVILIQNMNISLGWVNGAITRFLKLMRTILDYKNMMTTMSSMKNPVCTGYNESLGKSLVSAMQRLNFLLFLHLQAPSINIKVLPLTVLAFT